MFDFLAETSGPLCGPRRTRREFLTIGALAPIGLSLPQFLAAKQASTFGT